MGFYEGYQLFRQARGEIELRCILTASGYLNISNGKPIIEIEKEESLEQQVNTFIHEIFHLTPKYWKYLNVGALPEDHPIELEIEEKTQVIYDNNPNLVKHLEKIIEEVRYKKSS